MRRWIFDRAVRSCGGRLRSVGSRARVIGRVDWSASGCRLSRRMMSLICVVVWDM